MAALLKPADAAAYIGGDMTESRLRKMAQRGDIAYRRDGRFLRFTADDLDAYVASCARPARMRTTREKRQNRKTA